VTITTFIVLVAGYLLGSIPFAYLLARRHRGIDLRLAGSGNVGAANLLRTTTKKIGVSAMALDVCKGIASVLLARQIDPGATGPAVAGIAAVLGHIYPVWLGFRGGKGVATPAACFRFSRRKPRRSRRWSFWCSSGGRGTSRSGPSRAR
jgi:glycerol-3-phosphate acyltransferase PlsY